DPGDQLARARDLLDRAQAPHGEEQLLDPLAVEPLHLDCRALAGADRYEHRRAFDVGQKIERQAAPRDPAEHDDRRGKHGHGHRPAYRDAGQSFDHVCRCPRKMDVKMVSDTFFRPSAVRITGPRRKKVSDTIFTPQPPETLTSI